MPSIGDRNSIAESMVKLRPWNERPSTDEISQNLDRYFPDHDLDRPILDQVEEDDEGVSDEDISTDVTQSDISIDHISHSWQASETGNNNNNTNNNNNNNSSNDDAASTSPLVSAQLIPDHSDASPLLQQQQLNLHQSGSVSFSNDISSNEMNDRILDMPDGQSTAIRRAHYKLRRVMNRKSIRVVVQEAQQRSQAAWVSPITPVFVPMSITAATQESAESDNDSQSSGDDLPNPTRRATPIRRRSTMLWGSRVAELPKNGSNRIRRRDRVRPRLPVALPEEMGKQTSKIVWARGKLIGKGSFGRVFMAVNGMCGDVMAVKQVEVPQIQSKRQMEKQEQMILKLYEEIKLMKDLDHINIVQYLGFEVDARYINIFLEYIPGGSILSMVRKMGCGFPMPVTRSFARQILCGLKYLHESGIVHRDIKGANILVDLHGTCKISDFGVSRRREYAEAYEERQLSYQAQGSVFWMAPEVVKQRDYSAKVDIWALGCVMVEMISANFPWSGENEFSAIFNIGRGRMPPLPENIDEQADAFMKRCFIADSTERPTAEELLSDPFCEKDLTYRFEDYIVPPEDCSDNDDNDDDYDDDDDYYGDTSFNDTSFNNSRNYGEDMLNDDGDDDENDKSLIN
ncbi:kinase-like domain-containing protein [Syncephalis fuscata]|nr:kinase-like domain-containing protein [Syncephalis fuscata]